MLSNASLPATHPLKVAEEALSPSDAPSAAVRMQKLWERVVARERAAIGMQAPGAVEQASFARRRQLQHLRKGAGPMLAMFGALRSAGWAYQGNRTLPGAGAKSQGIPEQSRSEQELFS